MGFQILGVAVAWQMYALTGSAFDLGLIGLAHFLPAAAFMLVAGQVADRYDRRRVLQLFQALEALAAAALAAGSVAGMVTKEFILAAVFVFGIGRAFEAPTSDRPCCPQWCRRYCFHARSPPRPRPPSSLP